MHLAEKYDRTVPRYTSYPTAPHFTPAVTERDYRQWLAEAGDAPDISLYVHVPFCDTMCWFCGCYTKIVNRYEPISAYLDVLRGEIALLATAIPGRAVVRHLHWGGGSPTMLAPADWTSLITALRQRLTLAADAEFAVEVDPRDVTQPYLASLAAVGVNRVSIGVQDFDPVVQQAINRDQPFAVVARVCQWLRELGIDRINLDLMYGLPHQTVDHVVAMAQQAVSLAPSRIALFGYAHVPWMKTHQKRIDEAALPGPRQRWEQVQAASATLLGHGFRAIGLDHFARDDDGLARALDGGGLRRNFQGYTTDAETVLLGLGASAIGSLPQGFVQNVAPLRDYARAVGERRLPIGRGLALSGEDRVRGRIIERLMCDLTVDVDAVCRAGGLDPATVDAAFPLLAELQDDGIVAIDGYRLTVLEAGRPFVRLVAAAFDAYLPHSQARHSRAV